MSTQFVNKLPRLFCSADVLNELIQKVQAQEGSDEIKKKHYADLPFAVEILDLPFTMVWTPATEDTTEILNDIGYPADRGSDALMLMFRRYDDGTDIEEIKAVVVATDSEGERSIGLMCKEIGLELSINAFYAAVIGTNRLLQDAGIYNQYSKLDHIKEGMLLDAEGGRISVKVVSGKDRPDMECFINKETIKWKTMRPYADEDNEYNDDEEEAEGALVETSDFQIEDGVLVRYNGHATDVMIPTGVTAIGNGASLTFFQSGVEKVTVPDGVKAIGGYAFFDCGTMKSIDLPASIETVEHHAFRQCSSLTTITIPDAVETVGRECFWGCVGLTEIRLPKNLKVIEEKAFSGCISVPEIEIPDGTEVIEDGAFWGDSCLEKVTIPASVTSIGDMVFCDCDNLTIYGIKGSYAEEYANDNDISFKAI